jgi:hypothetical protein
MIVEESSPPLCRLGITRRFPHPAQHRSLRNIEAEHLQFTVYARRTPGRVLSHHSVDEFAQFPAHTSSARMLPMPREPRPIQFESCPMPADDRLRLDKNQCLPPTRPEPPQYHPKQLIESGKPRLWMPLFQDGKLLPQSEDFQEQ